MIIYAMKYSIYFYVSQLKFWYILFEGGGGHTGNAQELFLNGD